MSEYGIKIKNISAGMLYDVNLGTRDYFTYTDAMLNNSLFSYYLKRNGLNVYRRKQDAEFSKDESTRDVVCLDFDFGSRSFDDEFSRLSKLLDEDMSDASKKIYSIDKAQALYLNYLKNNVPDAIASDIESSIDDMLDKALEKQENRRKHK